MFLQRDRYFLPYDTVFLTNVLTLFQATLFFFVFREMVFYVVGCHTIEYSLLVHFAPGSRF